MASNLSGILPLLPTPFDMSGKVDLTAMEKVAQFCLDSDTLTNAECPSLTQFYYDSFI